MASTQEFTGDFSSQLHQLNGNHFHGPVSISTPDPKNRGKFAHQAWNEVEGESESPLDKELSWDDCLHSLAFDGSRDRESVIDRHADGTCEWLLKSPTYLRWVNEHGLLLIRGQPGCGKSTLLKFAYGKQVEDDASIGSLAISFFFYASGTELQNSIVGLFRSLLLQLFEQDISSRSAFHEICRKRWTAEGKKNNHLRWHQNELQIYFERLILECSTRRKTTIFIDAIDECKDQERDRLISFFHNLKGRAHLRLNRPRICFTCRLYPDGQIDADYHIRLEEKSQHDIQKFIEQTLRLPDETESSVNKLKETLQNKSDGIFLWLVLVIQQVHDMAGKGLNLTIIQSKILKCPQELNSLYEDLLTKIEDNELLEARTLFWWICFAARPLSLDELRTAMTVHLTGTKSSLKEYEDESNLNYIPNEHKMKKRMIYLSRGLADIANSKSAEEKALVEFYHKSIKDFMLTNGLQYLNRRLIEYRNLPDVGHFQLANTCINYLSAKEICIAFSEKRKISSTQFCFLNYAATYWLFHAIEADKDGSGEDVAWPSQNILNTWIGTCNMLGMDSTCPEEETSLMHIAAQHGLDRLAKSILNLDGQQATTRTQSKSRLHDTPHSKGQRPVKIPPKDNRKLNIVKPKSIRKNLQARQKESDVNQSSSGLLQDTTSRNVQKSTNSVQKIPREAEKRSKTRLYEAAAKDHRTMVNKRNKAGESPLHLAAHFGRIEMVKFLLKHGGEVNIVDRDGRTPLYTASRGGHLEVVKFLFQRKADTDVHTAMKNGWTPINVASSNGHLEVVKFLYEHGADADIHVATKIGWTPLYTASKNGHLEVVKFLYEHGADTDIHTATNTGGILLHTASAYGHLEVVEFLYEHGADTDIHILATKYGWTPINLASSNGHLEVVKFLYEHGADTDIHTATNDGWTPLNAASMNGHLKVVKFLYEHGADTDIHTATNDGWTPINLASSNGHLEVVKFLYEHGADADIHTATNDGWTPLNAASSNDHLEVVKFLYEHGADTDIHTATNRGWTPLNAASSYGHLKVVKFLYEHGADPTVADNSGCMSLHTACRSGHLEVVEYILDVCMCISTTMPAEQVQPTIQILNKQDMLRRTPLCHAVHACRKQVIQGLLDHHADISLIDCYGRRVTDWLVMFNSTSLLLGIRQTDFHQSSAEEQAKALYQTVQFICEENIQSTSISWFYELGRCLIYLDDIPSALKVFEQCTTSDGDDITHDAYCSTCDDNTKIRGRRFVCKLCPNIDLCSQCFAGYEDSMSNESCRSHEFLQIPAPSNTSIIASTCPVVHMSKNERDKWLRALKLKYQTRSFKESVPDDDQIQSFSKSD